MLYRSPSPQEFNKIYELMRHGRYLFVKRVVGVMLKEEINPPEGFVFQKIVADGSKLIFIYTDLKFKPLVWTKKKLDRHLTELFSFLPQGIIETDEGKLSALEGFNVGPCFPHVSYPRESSLPEGKEGVEYRKGDKVLSFLKGEGKPLPKWETLTVLHPLCPLPIFVL